MVPLRCNHCSIYWHLEEECRKKKMARQEWKEVGSYRQEKEVGADQHNQQAEFIKPRRTSRRSPSKERVNEEPITNSFQAVLENEIVDMVSHENGAMPVPHG